LAIDSATPAFAGQALTIGLLAELPAILMMDADRMAACLGKPVSSTIHALIGPCRSIFGTTSSRTLASTRSSDQRSLADEMQQLLMLHRNPARRRHRRHRLNALAALRRQ
jgi:hypothetical protein